MRNRTEPDQAGPFSRTPVTGIRANAGTGKLLTAAPGRAQWNAGRKPPHAGEALKAASMETGSHNDQ